MSEYSLTLVHLGIVLNLFMFVLLLQRQDDMLKEFRGTYYSVLTWLMIALFWVLTVIVSIAMYRIHDTPVLALYWTPPVLLGMLIISYVIQSIIGGFFQDRLEAKAKRERHRKWGSL